MQKLERHPLSAAWPAVESEVSEDLLKSIETHGIREPIMIYEGRILDGWHRYTSCLKLGVACPSMEFPEEHDPVAFVIDRNGNRRSLTAGERTKAILRCVEWGGGRHRVTPAQDTAPDGVIPEPPTDGIPESSGDEPPEPPSPPEPPPMSNEDIAKVAGTTVRTVQRQKKAIREEDGEPAPPKDTSPKPPPLVDQIRDIRADLGRERARIVEREQQLLDVTTQRDELLQKANPATAAGISEMNGVQNDNSMLRARVSELQSKLNDSGREVRSLRAKVRDLEPQALRAISLEKEIEALTDGAPA